MPKAKTVKMSGHFDMLGTVPVRFGCQLELLSMSILSEGSFHISGLDGITDSAKDDQV